MIYPPKPPVPQLTVDPRVSQSFSIPVFITRAASLETTITADSYKENDNQPNSTTVPIDCPSGEETNSSTNSIKKHLSLDGSSESHNSSETIQQQFDPKTKVMIPKKSMSSHTGNDKVPNPTKSQSSPTSTDKVTTPQKLKSSRSKTDSHLSPVPSNTSPSSEYIDTSVHSEIPTTPSSPSLTPTGSLSDESDKSKNPATVKPSSNTSSPTVSSTSLEHIPQNIPQAVTLPPTTQPIALATSTPPPYIHIHNFLQTTVPNTDRQHKSSSPTLAHIHNTLTTTVHKNTIHNDTDRQHKSSKPSQFNTVRNTQCSSNNADEAPPLCSGSDSDREGQPTHKPKPTTQYKTTPNSNADRQHKSSIPTPSNTKHSLTSTNSSHPPAPSQPTDDPTKPSSVPPSFPTNGTPTTPSFDYSLFPDLLPFDSTSPPTLAKYLLRDVFKQSYMSTPITWHNPTFKAPPKSSTTLSIPSCHTRFLQESRKQYQVSYESNKSALHAYHAAHLLEELHRNRYFHIFFLGYRLQPTIPWQSQFSNHSLDDQSKAEQIWADNYPAHHCNYVRLICTSTFESVKHSEPQQPPFPTFQFLPDGNTNHPSYTTNVSTNQVTMSDLQSAYKLYYDNHACCPTLQPGKGYYQVFFIHNENTANCTYQHPCLLCSDISGCPFIRNELHILPEQISSNLLTPPASKPSVTTPSQSSHPHSSHPPKTVTINSTPFPPTPSKSSHPQPSYPPKTVTINSKPAPTSLCTDTSSPNTTLQQSSTLQTHDPSPVPSTDSPKSPSNQPPLEPSANDPPRPPPTGSNTSHNADGVAGTQSDDDDDDEDEEEPDGTHERDVGTDHVNSDNDDDYDSESDDGSDHVYVDNPSANHTEPNNSDEHEQNHDNDMGNLFSLGIELDASLPSSSLDALDAFGLDATLDLDTDPADFSEYDKTNQSNLQRRHNNEDVENEDEHSQDDDDDDNNNYDDDNDEANNNVNNNNPDGDWTETSAKSNAKRERKISNKANKIAKDKQASEAKLQASKAKATKAKEHAIAAQAVQLAISNTNVLKNALKVSTTTEPEPVSKKVNSMRTWLLN